ncbi:septum formation family protein [Lysobacter korlensis]|uniref:Septum formation family protein n=1 Tax=Lysobacter korlensis TaxID=553636 RepID=A0ABV6RUM5_9GAMM
MNSSRNIRTITRTAVAVSALLLAGVTLSGCSALQDLLRAEPEAVRDESGRVVEGGENDVFSIEVGDCVTQDVSAEAEEVSAVPVVPCSEPHDLEVYAEFTIDGEEYPGDEQADTLATEGCLAEFGEFVGLSYEQSALDYTFYRPTEESWNEADDRLVSCLVGDPAGQVSESLKGAAR